MDRDREQRRKEFELMGARARLDELDQERASIIEEYPQLARPAVVPWSEKRVPVLEAARMSSHLVAKAKLEQRRLPKKTRERRTYDEAFKAQAVGRLAAGEYVPDVARSEGVRESVLRTWAAKANVKCPTMSWEERLRRMQGKGFVPAAPVARALPPPTVNNKKTASVRIGVALLGAMPDHEPIHYKDLAKKLGETDVNIQWQLKVRRLSNHVKRLSKGMYQKTEKGRKFHEDNGGAG
jgi:transposase-like protein